MNSKGEYALRDLIEEKSGRTILEMVLESWIDRAEASGIDPTPFMDNYNFNYEIREIYSHADLEQAKQDAEKTNSHLFQPSTGGVAYIVKKKG